MQIHPYLDLDEQAETIVCRKCQNEFCRGNENYKEYAVMRTGPVEELYPVYEPPDEILGRETDLEFRQFYCPGCGRLLDTEFALEDDPLIHDIEIDMSAV
jgi:acetone carboxylase gamma subunit